MNRYLPGLHHLSALTVEAGRYRSPHFGQRHHRSRVENPESKKVVELKTHPVHRPLEASFGVKKRVTLRGQHRQMLNVPPC